MNTKWIAGVVLVAALAVPAVARAHKGHAHKVMGTVTRVDGHHVTVKTAAGKSVTVMLDDKTTVSRGKTQLDATAVKVGERVVVEGPEAKDMITAKTVRLGVAAASATR